jgi:hypothetical protein
MRSAKITVVGRKPPMSILPDCFLESVMWKREHRLQLPTSILVPNACGITILFLRVLRPTLEGRPINCHKGCSTPVVSSQASADYLTREWGKAMRLMNFFRKGRKYRQPTPSGKPVVANQATARSLSSEENEKIKNVVEGMFASVEQRIVFDGHMPSRGTKFERDQLQLESAFNEAFSRSRYRPKIKAVGEIKVIENGKTFMIDITFKGSLEESVDFQAFVVSVFKKHGLR